MNLWMDPLCDPLTTRPIQTGWEFTMEPYPIGQFGFIDDPDRQFGNDSVWTRTWARSDGPEPLLTLPGCSSHLGRSSDTAVYLHERSLNECLKRQNDHDGYQEPYKMPYKMLHGFGKPMHDTDSNNIWCQALLQTLQPFE